MQYYFLSYVYLDKEKIFFIMRKNLYCYNKILKINYSLKCILWCLKKCFRMYLIQGTYIDCLELGVATIISKMRGFL
jgi:hypothetical protein